MTPSVFWVKKAFQHALKGFFYENTEGYTLIVLVTNFFIDGGFLQNSEPYAF